ncbi:uncharacterized protein [Asterias amurensis]|uniref:uncharacterized protein n=1 Tax=Asterias amurensis TaxID=7602 RepID=UPI003AB4CC0A
MMPMVAVAGGSQPPNIQPNHDCCGSGCAAGIREGCLTFSPVVAVKAEEMIAVEAAPAIMEVETFTATTGLKVRQPFPDDGVKRCPLCGAKKTPPPAKPQSWWDWMFGGLAAATTARTTTPRAGSYEPLSSEETQSPPPEIIKLTARDLFGMTYGMIQPPDYSTNSESLLQVTVQVHMLKSNEQVTVDVMTNSTVKELREAAAKKLNLRPATLMLIYDNSQLEDHQEIKYQGIVSGCMIYGMKCTRGQKMGIFELDPASMAPKFDYDFTNEKDDGETYKRGNFKYQRPYGWNRYAIKVVGEYEDDIWLGPNGIRTATTPGEWPVSYHGTATCNVRGIVEEGYKIGHRQLFGKGVYTSPSYKNVDEHYGQNFTHGGKRYRLILQNRVNEKGLKVVDPSETGIPDFPYWVSQQQDPAKGIFEVRPYGILTREV